MWGLTHWRIKDRPRDQEDEKVLRGDLLNIEQLSQHAENFARKHRLSSSRNSTMLIDRLDKNERVLRAYNLSTSAQDSNRRLTPAAEWLLDNFYLIEEQIQMARRHFPKEYSRELPCSASGLPRVYEIVLELITHVDAQIDSESLSAFISAYQRITPLKLGELWAIPIMLRLGLIENLQRITTHLAVARKNRDVAHHWIKRFQSFQEKNPSLFVVVMAEMVQSELPLSSAFVTEFFQSLTRQNSAIHWARNWFDQLLGEKGLSIDQLVQEENQRQASDQVSVSHSITSLRFLSAMNWKEFVETMSLVDAELRRDPHDVYSDMDFFSRDSYRHVIEEIAASSDLSEIEVAQLAIRLARNNTRTLGSHDRASHVGYYLLHHGRLLLEKTALKRISFKTLVDRLIRKFPKTFYHGGIVLSTAFISIPLIVSLEGRGVSLAEEIILSTLLILAASQLAIATMNWISTLLLTPRTLPRLDFSDKIPSNYTTMVVIPTLLSSSGNIERLVEALEIHYLGNRSSSLYFALLTDFPDAPTETLPEDEALLRQVRLGIESLNEKYKEEDNHPFFLFHRPRLWNAAENKWIGYERKRGKLSDLNVLLQKRSSDRFSEIIGDLTGLPEVKFIITLDTDTQMPRDAAHQMVGTLAHPLNRPVIDPEKNIVTEGYAILQPRPAISLQSANRTWFGHLFTGDVGVDPYTRASSDVYQDLFEEGSFIGKGIYDLDAFEKVTGGRFPENTILSHDLIESCHARSGLLSDVILYEDHPTSYLTELGRQHRWIRGDWQIARWLFSSVPLGDDKKGRNPLSFLSQWKIFDNLRRSLVPIALMALILIAWLAIPEIESTAYTILFWTLSGSAILSMSSIVLRKPKELPFTLYMRETLLSAGKHFTQVFLNLVFLPSDVSMRLDAILRTQWRLWISKKNRLEWQSAGESERGSRKTLSGSYLRLWMAPVLSIVVAILLIQFRNGIDFLQGLLLSLWFFSPLIAWSMCQPIGTDLPTLNESQKLYLRRISRKTWRFFEVFVCDEENWLPPDNFQEIPTEIVASRTSPTNMGLALLSNLTAWDFGYISQKTLIERTHKTFTTLDRLEQHQGHFYNWYDTRTLKPMRPHYISSVDSGNLAGHLLVLSTGLTNTADTSIFTSKIFEGLRDTASLLEEAAGESRDLSLVLTTLEKPTEYLHVGFSRLRELSGPISNLVRIHEHSDNSEIRYWSQSLERQLNDHLQDLSELAPWIEKTSNLTALSELPSLNGLHIHLEESPTLRDLAELSQTVCPLIEEVLKNSSGSNEGLSRLLAAFHLASEKASERILTLEKLSQRSQEMAQMDFHFLFDEGRNLFTIGYNVDECRRDRSYYDLLASEARLCSYVAIALGQVRQDHWFSLGRLLLPTEDGPILASWSGSYFEYMMPLLVMPNYPMTLMHQTYQACTEHQIAYGELKDVPWGISESGYNRTDSNFNYQYRAFGVPGLGLKRGLGEDLVIAPYAAVMGLMTQPLKSYENLNRLTKEGFEGKYGFYEAIDFTPSRLAPGQSHVILRSFMAHHQGMSFLSLDYVLHNEPMQRRFIGCTLLKSATLLLQERIPKTSANIFPENVEISKTKKRTTESETTTRFFNTPHLPSPEVHLLTNGRYQVVISTSGGGYSRWQNFAMTRWREDSTRDNWGNFFYIRETSSDQMWSSTYQPTLQSDQLYEAIFNQGRAEFRRRFDHIETHTEICISPEDDVELRRLTLVNHSPDPMEIEITSYAEVVLASQAAESAHPAFSNLFVQTEYLPTNSALLCTRRARGEKETIPWLFHLLIAEGEESAPVTYETDRSKFIGRGRTPQNPISFKGPLQNSSGSVLDPIVAMRRTIRLEAHQSIRIHSIIGVADQRETAVALSEKYHNPRMVERALELGWTHSQVILRHLNISEKEAQLYMQLAGGILYPNASRRAPSSVLLANRRTQSALWSYGISGDLPIVVLRIRNQQKIPLVQQLLQAHAYWRSKGLIVDLIILNEDDSHYLQSLFEQIIQMITSGPEAALLDKHGGIFVRKIDQIHPEDRILLQAVAHILFDDENGTLEEQMDLPVPRIPALPQLIPSKGPDFPAIHLPPRELVFQNGIGGFTPDGREYVMTMDASTVSPAPWVNVIANPEFGTVVSESGSAYTWAENCHEYRITPWNNDPVSDPSGETFYLRDEQTGKVWSPTPLPAKGKNPYVIRHGFGYTVFEHEEQGILTELWIYVAMDAPVKFAYFKIRNISGRPRSISVTGYWEWVLGDSRSRNLLHLQTQIDPKSGALCVRNPYHLEFSERIVFVDVHEPNRSVTGDRKEFIGRNGSLASPSGLKRVRLSGRVGAGLDPCGAVQTYHELAPDEEKEVCFRLGVGKNPGEVQALIQRFRRPSAVQKTLQEVHDHWNHTLGAVQIETPDPSINIMTNGWLLYQTLSCRMWARTGFYQSGGAYGFRDQLQDSMALIYSKPGLVREHLLRAAAQQFREGDVQHWWHPPSGRGVRTHFSDDFLWLPFVACHYVQTVGDTGVLDEMISFIDGRLLRSDEESNFDLPSRSGESATLYQHCVRAIEHGLRWGSHGLPLMGCGDWNDGMNLVGKEGRGESVWLAFFLYDLLQKFSIIAKNHQDPLFAEKCLSEAEKLRQNIEKEAWDGEWYKRAYFDDGTPLGSRENTECQIDSLPQSWSIISGAGEPIRSKCAMDAVFKRLVRPDAGLVQLFDPPFEASDLNPGYIKGYIPGVRENGGQYTHGAIWTTMATAMLGENDKAWNLFHLLNPIHHGNSPDRIATYKVEPYVVAADVYAVTPHVGRGGWTWYTGSAGWMYRLLIETLLGLHLHGEELELTPRFPKEWNSFTIRYRYRQTVYQITLSSAENAQLFVDGKSIEGNRFRMIDDQVPHWVDCKVAQK